LRARIEDILPLALDYLREISRLEHKYIVGFGVGVQEYLMAQNWRLNDVGLRQAIWRAVVLCEDETLELSHFKIEAPVVAHKLPQIEVKPHVSEVQPHGFSIFKAGQLREFDALEQDIYKQAMAHYAGNVSEVARKLGVGRSTLYRKLSQYGMISP
jgi:DNA-binding NtrC family response regulator